MKPYLLIPFLLFYCVNVFGQSVTMNDLTAVSNMANSEAHRYLVLNKKFKQQYLQDVNGNTVEHLNRVVNKKEETVIIGVNNKLKSGTVLRTVTYTTITPEHITNLIDQAKNEGLKLKFKGSDKKNDIYIFDNDFFHIVIFRNHDNISGSVEVHQKEYLGFE